MRRVGAAVMIVIALLMGSQGVATAAPYVSCPGGYIAASGDKCPPFRTPISVHPGKGGGGTKGGGGLLGTVGRILGGLSGGLLG